MPESLSLAVYGVYFIRIGATAFSAPVCVRAIGYYTYIRDVYRDVCSSIMNICTIVSGPHDSSERAGVCASACIRGGHYAI